MKVWILAIFSFLTLTACSGGGDSSSTPASGNESTTMMWDQSNWDSKNWE